MDPCLTELKSAAHSVIYEFNRTKIRRHSVIYESNRTNTRWFMIRQRQTCLPALRDRSHAEGLRVCSHQASESGHERQV